MTKNKSCHLMDILAEVDDPRNKKGIRHPLEAILGLLVVGFMCGHKGYTSIATWARTQPQLTKALGFTRDNTPCAGTIHNFLKKLDVVAVEKTLTKWVNSVMGSDPDLKNCLNAVSIDGKTMRASQKSGAAINHLLSVVSHELGITLTQIKVDNKTNEIPVSKEILNAFDVRGKVITTDALLTQKTFCQDIIDKGGYYLLPVKDNQTDLLADITKLFEDISYPYSNDTTEVHPHLGEPFSVYETIEKAHGRIETRCVIASTSLNEYLDWPGVAQVFQYHTIVKNTRTGEETHRVHYGITSLDPDEASAEQLLALRRGHWSIENKSHWMRDTLLGEDASPVRCGAIPQVMAALRNTALSVFRFSGVTRIADAMRYYASKPKLAVNLIE
jgi:predicted transposase YbfD/YdcC